MSLRLRRLEADYEAIKRLAAEHPRISVEGASGEPPDRYRIVLNVRSLQERAGEIVEANRHVLEVVLPQGYPRDAPMCRMITPVFHPNIAPHAVCIGDHWTAGEGLDLMIQRVGEMLAFQSYNLKSPLNGRAARWVEDNPARLPVDLQEFFHDVAPAPDAGHAGLACTNCGTASVPLARCHRGHQPCRDCVVACPACGGPACLACGSSGCGRCAAAQPAAELARDGAMPAPAAALPMATPPATSAARATGACANCLASAWSPPCGRGHALCEDCAMNCKRCGRALCLACSETACSACG